MLRRWLAVDWGGFGWMRERWDDTPHSESADHAALEVLARWVIIERWRVRENWVGVVLGRAGLWGRSFARTRKTASGTQALQVDVG